MEANQSLSGEGALQNNTLSREYDLLPSTRRVYANETNVTTNTDEHFNENDFSMPDELDYKQ